MSSARTASGGSRGRRMIRVVLCDIGGVLVKFDASLTVEALIELGASREKARGYFLREDYRCLARGGISQEQYWESLRSEWGLDASSDSLSQVHAAHITGLAAAVYDRVSNLAVPVYLVTNTVPVEFDRHCELFSLAAVSMGVWRSDEQHCLKADCGTFAAIVDSWLPHALGLKVEPQQVVFVDDSPANICAAETCGVAGHCFKTVENLNVFLRYHAL